MLSFLHSPTLTSIQGYGKTIALIRWTFVGKAMSLLFNMLSRLVITFLPRSKRGSPACAWADAGAVIPWTLYRFTGDLALLRRTYANMRMWSEWLCHMDDQTGSRRLWQAGAHFDLQEGPCKSA